jgi:hypothetical protein
VLDIGPKMRCRECDAEGRAIVRSFDRFQATRSCHFRSETHYDEPQHRDKSRCVYLRGYRVSRCVLPTSPGSMICQPMFGVGAEKNRFNAIFFTG